MKLDQIFLYTRLFIFFHYDCTKNYIQQRYCTTFPLRVITMHRGFNSTELHPINTTSNPPTDTSKRRHKRPGVPANQSRPPFRPILREDHHQRRDLARESVLRADSARLRHDISSLLALCRAYAGLQG